MRTEKAFADRLKAAAGDAYRNYLDTREQVWRMVEHGSGEEPSAYWTEELQALEYMLDASPLVVQRLRHHTHHITGLRVYDYRTGRDEQRRQLARKLAELRRVGGEDLVVPEARELGGFGFDIDGALYNIDTLKFLEALIALDRGGVLGALRRDGGRGRVLEIGSGWGGFAYQFKRLFPRVSYAIVDLPELFVFSATYLRTLFPDATVRFHTEGSARQAGTEDVDFEFIPVGALEAYRPERLDLVANMVSFQEMTTDQVRRYATHLHDIGARCLYSLNRDRSSYNHELSSVREILSEYFWLYEFPILGVPYTRMLPEPPARRRRIPLPRRTGAVQPGDNVYRHLIGRRRRAP